MGNPLPISSHARAEFHGIILLPDGTSIVLPVGYRGQPTGLLHIYLWRRLCGRSAEEVIWITSLGGNVNFEFLKITAP